MADLSTLARPYAKAAFDYANENGVVNDWENFLFIAATVVNDKSFSTWLDNPAVSAEHKSAALVDLYDTQVASANDSAFKQLFWHPVTPNLNLWGSSLPKYLSFNFTVL